MKHTRLTLTSSDHEALAVAVKKIFNGTARTARVTLVKAKRRGELRIYGVDVDFDTFDKELVELLQKIDFTNNVRASFREVS